MATGNSGGGGDVPVLDDIIKRRLLIDGDGTGDERRIMTLSKSLTNFCTADESPEECEVSFRRLLGQLRQVEYAVKRTNLCIKISEDTKTAYDECGNRVKQEIDETKNQIAESKIVLEEATKLRKCSMEYDALAKLIQSKPDRKETEQKCIKMTKHFEQLNKRKQALNDKLVQRKHNVKYMTSELSKLRKITTEEDDSERQMHGALIEEDESSRDVAAAAVQISKASISTTASTNSAKKVRISDKVHRIKSAESDGSCSSSSLDAATPTDQIPMESNTDGELNQSESPHGSNIRGTVTSAPLSPVEKLGLENYEDLSEEENEVEAT